MAPTDEDLHDAVIQAGAARLWVLEAGRARHPGAWVGPGAAVAEWLWSPINVCVIEVGADVLLVDSGLGLLGAWWPFAGCWCDLDGALRRAGLGRERVTMVVLTHLDFDHVGGVVGGAWPGELVPAFPGIPVVAALEAVEAAQADDPDAELNAATHVCRALDTAGVLRTFSGTTELAPGVVVAPAPGHRPGHSVVRLEGGIAPVVFAADVLHHVLHAEHPEWDHLGDLDPVAALATRRSFLASVADSGTPVFFAHIDAKPAREVVARAEAWELAPLRRDARDQP
ncbi:MAG: MBL fold metallo-hydrolase [Gaiellales bacterium]